MRTFDDVAGQVQAIAPDGSTVFHQVITNPGPDTTCVNSEVGPIEARDAVSGETLAVFEGLCTFVQPDDCTEGYPEWLLGISVSADGKWVVGGGVSGVVSMWDAMTGEKMWTWDASDEHGPFAGVEVSAVSVAPDGSRVAVAQRGPESGSSIVILDIDGEAITSLPTPESWLVEYSPAGDRLVAAGGELKMFEADDWEVVWDVPDPHDGAIDHFDISTDGKRIVTGGADGYVRVWDAADGRLVHEVSLGDDWAKAVAFIGNEEVLVGTDAGLIIGLTVDTERLIAIAESRLRRGFSDQECQTYLLDECEG